MTETRSPGSYHSGPGLDVNLFMQLSRKEDEQQQGEEEGRAADELKEVERRAGEAAVHRLLQDEGNEGQHLREKQEVSTGEHRIETQVRVAPGTTPVGFIHQTVGMLERHVLLKQSPTCEHYCESVTACETTAAHLLRTALCRDGPAGSPS